MIGSDMKLRSSLAFTFTDLLVILAVLSITVALIYSHLVLAKQTSRLALCTANLGQIASRAVLNYCSDNHQTLPTIPAGQTGEPWWLYKEQVKRYLGLTGPSSTNDTVFACPDDRGYSDNTPFHKNARFDFSSYVYNGVTLPGMPNIAGWPVSAVKHPAKTLLVMEWTAHAPLSWHRSKTDCAKPAVLLRRAERGWIRGWTRKFHQNLLRRLQRRLHHDPIEGYDYQYSGN